MVSFEEKAREFLDLIIKDGPKPHPQFLIQVLGKTLRDAYQAGQAEMKERALSAGCRQPAVTTDICCAYCSANIRALPLAEEGKP